MTTASDDGRLKSFSFSEEAPDAVISFHVVLLPLQCFVWIGQGRPKIDNLVAAAQTPYDSAPSCSTLLGSTASSETHSMSQRLAKFLKMPVICSCSLPQNTPLLQAFAERKLKEKLQALIS